MGRYTSKLQNIQEANKRLEQRLINEQSTVQPNDVWKICLGFLYNYKVEGGDPNILKYKGDVMRYCQAKRDGKEPKELSPEANTMLTTLLKTLENSSQKEYYKKEGENVKIGE